MPFFCRPAAGPQLAGRISVDEKTNVTLYGSLIAEMDRDPAPEHVRSFELDCAFDIDREIDPADRQCDLGGQRLVALEPSVADGRANRLLDLPLGGNADFLEEFSHAHVEHVFIHDRLPRALGLREHSQFETQEHAPPFFDV